MWKVRSGRRMALLVCAFAVIVGVVLGTFWIRMQSSTAAENARRSIDFLDKSVIEALSVNGLCSSMSFGLIEPDISGLMIGNRLLTRLLDSHGMLRQCDTFGISVSNYNTLAWWDSVNGTSFREVILDPWGTPFYCCMSADYESFRMKRCVHLVPNTGWVETDVSPIRSEINQSFENPKTFQIVSAGPDMMFGTPDDVCNW